MSVLALIKTWQVVKIHFPYFNLFYYNLISGEEYSEELTATSLINQCYRCVGKQWPAAVVLMVLGNILKYILDTDQQGGADLDTDKAFDKVSQSYCIIGILSQMIFLFFTSQICVFFRRKQKCALHLDAFVSIFFYFLFLFSE